MKGIRAESRFPSVATCILTLCTAMHNTCSGGNDVIFPSIHEFEKALEDGFMGLWDSASNATGSAEGSVLDVLGVGDWKIVTTS